MKLELILNKYSDLGDCNETGLASPDPEAVLVLYLIKLPWHLDTNPMTNHRHLSPGHPAYQTGPVPVA